MYSFEGEFRRRPQQNLSGASRKHERNELLQRAQIERSKREELRRRQNSAITIQSSVRSYLTRQRHKKLQRDEFDKMLQAYKAQMMPEETLAVLLQKLLFFYNESTDVQRLVSVSQLLLKKHEGILKIADECWLWRIQRLLHLNLLQMERAGSRDSLAVGLRIVEVFTSWESSTRVLGTNGATSYLVKLFSHLIAHGYFRQVRRLVDSRTPPVMGPSSSPPTQLAACLFELIARPLNVVTRVPDNRFSALVLQGLCQHILASPMTKAVEMFIIPALVDLPLFPFRELLDALRHCEGFAEGEGSVQRSTSLLFSVLSLEKKHFIAGKDDEEPLLLLGYLQILAALTKNFTALTRNQGVLDDSGSDNSAEEMDHEGADAQEMRILEYCVEMLNDTVRVQYLLSAIDQSEDPQVLQALCQVCHNLLISNKFAIHKYKLIHMLAFRPTFLRHLWSAILAVRQTSLFGSATPLLHIVSRGLPLTSDDSARIVPLLAVFCSLFSLLLITLHDGEFYGDDTVIGGSPPTMPFTLQSLVQLSLTLKEVSLGLVELAFPDSRPSVRDDYKAAVRGREQASPACPQDTQMWAHLFKVTVGLVRQLHSRDIRRPFCPENHWISKQITIPVDKPSDFTLRRHRLRVYRPFQGLRAFTREELEEGPPLSTKEIRTITILRELPFLVPFQERVLVFQSLIMRDKAEHQGEQSNFLQGPSIQVAIRRNYLYEDAFDKLSSENEPELRLKMRVQLVNEVGMDEAGVDGGGIFREFLSELLKTAFDPNRGFFRLTKDNFLYPNPSVHLLFDDFPKHYFFIGRMLGKALYENLLVELPFAEFFLSKLVGRHSDVDVHHLASLDPLMYRNLLYLKNYDGDVADLGLDFTVLNEELGKTRVDELKEGGANIQVTALNRIEYIHLVADYRLNRQMRAQCNAFKQGLANVIPPEWLQMFNNKELQVLISGAQVPVDVEDLKQHTVYAGGYTQEHPTILAFWQVVEDFSDIQKRQLLKFVTSCSRPPLLGFKELEPPFCVQHAGSSDRLPTASTCMNLLKLPEFPDANTLRDKLLYAIQAGAGFELS